jgi:hypothetical protein
VERGKGGAGPVGELIAGVAGVVPVVPAVQLPVVPGAVEVEHGDLGREPVRHGHPGGRRGLFDRGRGVVVVPPPLVRNDVQALGRVPAGGRL